MKHVLTLIRFTRRYFSGCTFFGAVLYCAAPLVLGLATRAFFDRVSDGSGSAVWYAIALLGALQVGEIATELAIGRTWSGFCQETHALLQRNTLAASCAASVASASPSRRATPSAGSGTSRPASPWARWTASPTSSAGACSPSSVVPSCGRSTR